MATNVSSDPISGVLCFENRTLGWLLVTLVVCRKTRVISTKVLPVLISDTGAGESNYIKNENPRSAVRVRTLNLYELGTE